MAIDAMVPWVFSGMEWFPACQGAFSLDYTTLPLKVAVRHGSHRAPEKSRQDGIDSDGRQNRARPPIPGAQVHARYGEPRERRPKLTMYQQQYQHRQPQCPDP